MIQSNQWTAIENIESLFTLLHETIDWREGVAELSACLLNLQSKLNAYTCVDFLYLVYFDHGVPNLNASNGEKRLRSTHAQSDFISLKDDIYIAQVLQQGVRLAFSAVDGHCALTEHSLRIPIQSWLGIPLFDRNAKILGVMVFNKVHDANAYSAQELALFEVIAKILVRKIDYVEVDAHIEYEIQQRTNALTIEINERQHAENLQTTLFEIAELSTKRLDATSLYASLHRILRRLFVVENFVIARFHAVSAEISIEYFIDKVDVLPEKMRFPLGVGMTSFVFRSRQAQLIDQQRLKHLIELGEIRQVVGNASMVSWMGAPMVLQEAIIGVVIVQSYDESILYTEKELSLLSFVAHHMATALGRLDADLALTQAQQDLQVQNQALHEKSVEQQCLIAKLQEAHEQLIQSEKMASVGQLAAGVAHEINNPIGFINSNMGALRQYVDTLFGVIDRYENLLQALPDTPLLFNEVQKIQNDADLMYLKDDVQSLVNESLDGLRRVKDIVQSLKDFSHVGETVWQEADIHQGIDSTLNVVMHDLRHKADIVKKYARIPALTCNISQLNQVFMSILLNAGYAIKEKGVITIETDEADGIICVQISDTGSGIASENIGRIFEPFFTTKPIGSGTGLGLFLAYGLVKKHRGWIEVDSAPGKGTSLKIFLPRS